jgi:predicted esterase
MAAGVEAGAASAVAGEIVAAGALQGLSAAITAHPSARNAYLIRGLRSAAQRGSPATAPTALHLTREAADSIISPRLNSRLINALSSP